MAADGSFHKVDGAREVVNHSQNDGITLRGWKTHDEIQNDLGPGTPWSGQGVEQSCRSLVRRHPLGTHRAGGEKALGVAEHGWPPKALTEEVKGMGYLMVTCQPRRVRLLQDLRVGGLGHKQGVQWSSPSVSS